MRIEKFPKQKNNLKTIIFSRVHAELHSSLHSDIRFDIKICFIKKRIQSYNLSLSGDYGFDNLLEFYCQFFNPDVDFSKQKPEKLLDGSSQDIS